MLEAEDFPDFCFVFYLGHNLLSLDQVRDEKKMRLQMIKKTLLNSVFQCVKGTIGTKVAFLVLVNPVQF